jgi:hypothetical protein
MQSERGETLSPQDLGAFLFVGRILLLNPAWCIDFAIAGLNCAIPKGHSVRSTDCAHQETDGQPPNRALEVTEDLQKISDAKGEKLCSGKSPAQSRVEK